MSAWSDDLSEWLKPFLSRLGHKARRRMCPLYVAGLIGPGERKSVGPMAERLAPGDYDQRHHFVSSGVWDAAPLEQELACQANGLVGGPQAVLVIDDTALPKKGSHSVGVAPQYASALGKNANCQTLVSLTLARGEVPLAVGLRLFLPESWTSDADRMSRAGVPEARRAPRTKPEIALTEIDRVRAAGLIFGTVLADAGYGMSAPFRQGLSARGLTWAVGIPGRQKVYPADVVLTWPDAGRGRPRKNPLPDPLSRPAKAMLAEAAWTELSWRTGTKGALKASFAAVRVRVADGPPQAHPRQGAATPARRGGVARRRAPRVGRAQVLSVEPAGRRRSAEARRHDQGPLGVRAGAPADEGGTRPRPLRGPILDGPAPARLDDHDRLRLPPVPPSPGRWGKKGSREGRLSRASPPSAARSPPFYRSRHNAVRTAVSASGDPLIQNCQRSAKSRSGEKLSLEKQL